MSVNQPSAERPPSRGRQRDHKATPTGPSRP